MFTPFTVIVPGPINKVLQLDYQTVFEPITIFVGITKSLILVGSPLGTKLVFKPITVFVDMEKSLDSNWGSIRCCTTVV